MSFVFQTFSEEFRSGLLQRRLFINQVAKGNRDSPNFRYLLCSAVCLFMLANGVQPAAADDAYFESHVRPLLVERCYKCHSGTRTSGGLALDSRSGWQKGGDSGAAIVAGKPDESLLIAAVKYEGLEMPPADAGGRLNDSEIAVLQQWIQSGAHDPREAGMRLGGMSQENAKSWWAFQPLPERHADTEATAHQSASDTVAPPHEIDAFLHAKQSANSLTANSTADRRTLLRRATYDLTGLPPTPDEVQQFVVDESPHAFAKVVNRLLESPQYGIRWGRHWLDIVRYADTAGENTDRPLPHAWRYRNWVFDAVNGDMPYDEFIRMQLAGDITCADGDAESYKQGIVATGYLAIARRFGHDIDKDIHLMHEDVIDNLGKNFLGLTIGCARCHDHKYDPVTAEDYYALYGIFNSTQFAFPGCEPQGQPRDLVPLIAKPDVDKLMNEWRKRNLSVEAEKAKREQSTGEVRNRLKQVVALPVTESTQVLASSAVTEGASVSFTDSQTRALDRISLHKGDVLQVTVFPNASHGADSTLLEFEISEVDGEHREWNLRNTVDGLLQGNPHNSEFDATWCFLETTDGPVFLTESKAAINGQNDLQAWSLGSEPSVFVNRAEHPVDVWTSLPASSFFVHPGIARPVTVAWICPADIIASVTGHIVDVHPSGGGDGVAFRLEHIAVPTYGADLVELGQLSNSADIRIEPTPVIPVAYAVVESTPKDSPLHKRGDPEQPGDIVPRHWLSVLGGDAVPPDGGSGRKQLGNWIAEHPLMARVMVNRIWQWHFGRGLVATPNDFGSRGARPDHPELLDWLATEFRASGYSIKAMHRLIMNSAAYQRSSKVTDFSASGDADNRLLTRFVRRRLDAEEIRDSMLMVAENLDTSPARNHPFPPEDSWTFTQHAPFNAVYETNKRSAYLMVQRQRRHPYLALFDGADPNASTPVREVTTAPTQALFFLNAPFFHEQAAKLGERIRQSGDDSQRVEFAFQVLLQRSPSPAEHVQAESFLNQYPGSAEDKWAAYSRVLLAANEFLYLD